MNRSVRFQKSASAALVTATVVLAAGFVSPVAGAQASGPVLEEITVSARKRAESLIDVPLTIEPLPVIDLGSRLPIIDLGEPLPAIDPSTLTEEHDQ